MDRWNELIAGFVLGNLTPEEAESIAKILAENPQLASHIARLRNTATVRSLSKAERSTARSQDGSEGWADTALDDPLPRHLSSSSKLELLTDRRPTADVAKPSDKPSEQIEKQPARRNAQTLLDSGQKSFSNSISASSTGTNTFATVAQKITRKIDKTRQLSHPTFERFSLAEALLVPAFNPLWWTAIALVVLVSADNLRVRRALQNMREELTQVEAAPRITPVDTAPVDITPVDITPTEQASPNQTKTPSQIAQ